MPAATYDITSSAATLRDGVSHGVAAIAALFVLVALRWSQYLLWPEVHGDEDIYIAAFQAVAAGGSPYSVPGYFYPAALASLGGWLISSLGETAVRFGMRMAVDLGLVLTVWLSLSIWRASYRVRLAVASVYLILAPAVSSGLENGNLSFAVIGLVILALFIWPQRPVVAGLFLGASVAVKPLAPLAITALFFHRPVPARWQHWAAGAVAGLFGIGLLLIFQPGMMADGFADNFAGIRTLSLVRIASLLGLQLSPYWIAAAVALGVLVLCRVRPMTALELVCVATTAAVFSLPVIWSHTLILTLPVQILAIVRASQRTQGGFSSRGTRGELLLVLLMVAAIQFFAGAEAMKGFPGLFQAPLLAVPFFAPTALTFYVLQTGEISDG